MGGGPDINYPAQPSYGEGMADALKAQVQLLTGTGDFAETGSLESLLPLEESIRKKTAQTDTDVLRQTLLGSEQKVVRDPETGKFGIPGAETITNAAGQAQTAGGGRYQTLNFGTDKPVPTIGGTSGGGSSMTPFATAFFDNETGGVVSLYDLMVRDGYINPGPTVRIGGKDIPSSRQTSFTQKAVDEGFVDATHFFHHKELNDQISNIITKGTVKYLGQMEQQTPEENAQTFEFTNPNTGEPLQEGEVVRAGDGMIDLLGDTRNITQYETKTATQADVDAGLADEVGKQFVQKIDTTDQAGFRDREFKGLSAMAEDIQRGNLSRQREADLQDVARLEPLFAQIMEDYKPGTTSALTGAKDLIEEQKGNLLRDVGISDPAKVQAQGVQADALRAGLMSDAEKALGGGLTDREERQIAEAARARSTMMGRTFDQSGAIAEAQARVAEDNQRRMQNRAFAQSVLGQEAGIQTSDDQRKMGADQFNVASQMDAEKLRESLRQQGLLGYLDAASRVSQLENQGQLDPFQAILGRTGGGSLQAGQSVFGQAGYGLSSQPSYLNPESGLGYIQNQATNAANMFAAQQAADATRSAGIMGGLGSAAGGLLSNKGLFCWVAREVYGEHNPAWKMFRMWMFTESPTWFFKLYKKYGERFAKFISDKPRIKARIRMWMDSKIRR